jgi:hypothetical protein
MGSQGGYWLKAGARLTRPGERHVAEGRVVLLTKEKACQIPFGDPLNPSYPHSAVCATSWSSTWTFVQA